MAGRDLFNLVGTTIAGKFRVERVLGEGGFGVVYAGQHVLLGEKVAIKCLKPLGFTPEDREQGAQAFLREARILFGLGHPAIVRLYDVGVIEQGQIPYVVLELLTGITLEADIRARAQTRRHFGREELVGLFGPILEAVAFAHERGIVHRDLKPANLMLVSDAGRIQPKVLDFGTARADVVGTGRAAFEGGKAGEAGRAAPEASLGKTGFTPLYAAPEQWDAAYGTTGARTDVYALGLTLAEMCLLGYPMDVAGGILAVFKASLDEGSRPVLAEARPDLPPELERVVLRAMRARPDQRYADARELLTAFRTALKAAPGTAPMAAPLSPSHAPPQAHASSFGLPHGLSPSYNPPQAVSYGPPVPVPAYVPSRPPQGASTTQPHTFGALGPHGPHAGGRSSALPWVIGIAVLVVTLLIVAVGVVVAIVLPSAATVAAPVPAEPTVAAAPGAPAPTSPATAATPAVPVVPAPRPGSTVAAGPAPRLILGGAIGMAPFWTQSDVMDVARTHHNEMIGCGREARAAQPGLEGPISITVSPNKNGVVESVQCSMRVHNTPGETALCGCVESTIGKWRFPPARGRLGFLDAGPFIYDYKLFSP